MSPWSNALVLAGALVLPVFGCSEGSDAGQGQPDASSGDDAAVDSGPSDAGTGSEADAGEAGPRCLSVNGTVFAVDYLYFGDMDWEGNIDSSAWKAFGSNLDGVVSDATSTGLCQPAAGALAEDVYPDGDSGIDNAFGKSVVPMLSSVSAGFSEQVNESIAVGYYTWLFKLDPFGPEPNQAPVSTNIYAADSLPSAPVLDGSDCWPVVRASLEDESDMDSAKIAFPNGELVANQLSTGTPGEVELAVPLAGTILRLTAQHARITIDFEGEEGVPTQGMISGVIDTEAFVEEARDVLGYLDPMMCSGPTFDAMATSIRQASDIMKDGTQDPSATCDGISMGIGFTIVPAGISGLGPPTPAGWDPCP